MSTRDSNSKRYISGPIGKRARPRVIVLDHLSASYQGQEILHDIYLSIYEGEAVAILGAPGAGKSILLACLQGLIQPGQGAIQVMAAALPPMTPELRRQTGLMPRHLDRTQHTTVSDLLQRFAAYYEIHLSQEQVNEYSQHYSLHPYTFVSELTPVQLHALKLASALVHDPRLILLDEPLAGLPEMEHALIKHYIRRMQREGRTLLVTFTPPVADDYLKEYDVIIRLEQGHIVNQQTGEH